MKWISKLAATTVFAVACISAQAQTVVEYIHTDALGSPVVVTDANQNVIEHTEYEPYGLQVNRLPQDGPGYTGHVGDSVTGLTYMQQRYYDSAIGMFLSTDPVSANLSTGGNFNRYRYANSNPYKFTDPDGRYVCSGNLSNCKNFETAIAMAAKASVNPKLSSEQRTALSKAVAFYGKPGTDNVKVSFGNLNGDYANISSDTQGRGTVKFDIAAIAGKDPYNSSGLVNGLAMRTLHEGDHGVRIMENGHPSSRAQRFEREQHGYRAEGYYQKATGYMQIGNNIWAPWNSGDGISEATVDARAKMSVTYSCAGSNEGSCR